MTMQHQKTETERLIEDTQMASLVKQPLTVRSILLTALIQAVIGAVLVNTVDFNGDFRWLALLGLILMLFGVAGTLMYSADLMKMDRRNRDLSKTQQHDKR